VVGDAGWALSDAWLLAAVRVTGTPRDPGSLVDLIAAADTLHRVIFSLAEIEHAVTRLLPAGLMTLAVLPADVSCADRTGYAATPAGRALVARGRGGANDRMRVLLGFLEEIDVVPTAWSLPAQVYRAACLDYRRTFWEEYRRPRRR
jgi:hypothetical protein